MVTEELRDAEACGERVRAVRHALFGKTTGNQHRTFLKSVRAADYGGIQGLARKTRGAIIDAAFGDGTLAPMVVALLTRRRDHAAVVFMALDRLSDNRAVIARYSGTTLTQITDNTLGSSGGPYTPMAMNAAGIALYGADGADPDASSDELFTVTPSGSPVSRFSVGTTFKQYLVGDLDDANVLTFTAYTVSGKYGLYRETGTNQYATLLETSAASDFIGEMYANSAGLVAFRAAFGGGTQGVYVYDPTTQQMDPVLLLGQTIGTSTITQMSMGEWNSVGQIPIALKLANGTEMIVRADPVPEPIALVLIACIALIGTRRHRI